MDAAIIFGPLRCDDRSARSAHTVLQGLAVGTQRKVANIRRISRYGVRARTIHGRAPDGYLAIHQGTVVNPVSVGRPNGMARHRNPGTVMQQHAAVRDPMRRRFAVHGLHVPEDIEGIAHHRGPLQPEGDAASIWRNHGTAEVGDLQKPKGRDRFRVHGTDVGKQYACRYHNRLDEREHQAFLESCRCNGAGGHSCARRFIWEGNARMRGGLTSASISRSSGSDRSPNSWSSRTEHSRRTSPREAEGAC